MSDASAPPPPAPGVLNPRPGRGAARARAPHTPRLDIEDFAAANGLLFLFSEYIPDEGVAMAVCKGNSDLLDSLDTALDSMRADGTLATLENRWF